MTNMLMKTGEVITIASGIFEGYDKTGPFVVAKDFDLSAFVDDAKATVTEEWEISGLMYQIPRMLVSQGFLTRMPCRPVYLGGLHEFELGEEADDFFLAGTYEPTGAGGESL